MQLQRSANKHWYRIALCMAFVAMQLLLVGPLISQYQSDGQHHAHHEASHHSSHQGGGHHQHTAPQASHHHHVGHAEEVEPIFNWFHQCGYCAIWQQFPTAHTSLPAISLQAFITHDQLLTQPTQAIKSCDNYPHALTRAPPFFRIV
ncbi:DUF2946 domain-containing protein [Halomonas colorata]|uniref:DUF2946 domain-containing protein n=1 Tax=Halomonas colorata TaxID=2742615 RepID=UPI0018695D91|nr:DUF2946 domain-containing protein [Halomonas colorata]